MKGHLFSFCSNFLVMLENLFTSENYIQSNTIERMFY